MMASLKNAFFRSKICFTIVVLGCIASCADDVTGGNNAKVDQDKKAISCEERLMATELGSVGFMKNMAESPDSIRAIADKQLRAALEPNQNIDSPNQTEVGKTKIIYRVKPVQFLPQDQQNELCLQLEKTTSITPFQYGPKEFTSVTGLNDWIMKFSRGNGEDGKHLYKQCGSNCSPRYTFTIDASEDTYIVTTDVLCGIARDAEDDQYELSTAIKGNCGSSQ